MAVLGLGSDMSQGYPHVVHVNSSAKKTVYFTSKDWNITEYSNYPAACVTHRHEEERGYRYVTSPSIFNKGFQCRVCHQKAPEEIIVIWKLLNWDILDWSEIQ